MWSIVKVSAHLDDERDWHALGYIAVDGDTLALIADDDSLSLRWVLPGRARQIITTSREDILAIVNDSSVNVALIESPSDMDFWVQEQLLKLGQEQRESDRMWDNPVPASGGLDDDDDDWDDEEDDDHAA